MRILIFGVGNILMGDDGFGALFAQRYKEELETKFSGKLKVIDIGVHSIPVVDQLKECSSLYFVDVLEPGGEEVQSKNFDTDLIIYSKEELTSFGENKLVMSSHSGGIMEILQAAELMDILPDKVLLVGSRPRDLSTRIGLSPGLEQTLPKVKSFLISEIEKDLS